MTQQASAPSKINGLNLILLLTGIILASMMDAIAGSSLSLIRLGMQGALHTSPDEFAWLDYSYTCAKLIGYMLVPVLLGRTIPIIFFRTNILAMILACTLLLWVQVWQINVGLRVIQGFCSGLVLVAAQAMLLQHFPLKQQPLLQALYALGAVVAPATLAPFIQGYLVESYGWEWVFFLGALLGLCSMIIFLSLKANALPASTPVTFEKIGFSLYIISILSLTYVTQQGSRWNGFESPRIQWLSALATVTLFLFIVWSILRLRTDAPSFLNLNIFSDGNYAFAFPISFVAGAVLFGSSYLIPGFSAGVLGFNATQIGLLLLPGVMAFSLIMLGIVLILAKRNVPIPLFIPFGITFAITSMYMLSKINIMSGTSDLFIPMLLRAAGLAILFLAMSLFALTGLKSTLNTQAVAAFTMLRQVGGLVTVALLQAKIDQHSANVNTAISAQLQTGNPLLEERLGLLSTELQLQGMEKADASAAATGLLVKTIKIQAISLSFAEAFLWIAIGFVIIVPCLLVYKGVLAKLIAR